MIDDKASEVCGECYDKIDGAKATGSAWDVMRNCSATFLPNIYTTCKEALERDENCSATFLPNIYTTCKEA